MSDEKKKLLRTIRVDEDALEVMFLYDDQWKIWIGQYPFFLRRNRDIRRPAGPGGMRSLQNVSITAAKVTTTAAPARISENRIIRI